MKGAPSTNTEAPAWRRAGILEETRKVPYPPGQRVYTPVGAARILSSGIGR